jgi:hypothetical protein
MWFLRTSMTTCLMARWSDRERLRVSCTDITSSTRVMKMRAGQVGWAMIQCTPIYRHLGAGP